MTTTATIEEGNKKKLYDVGSPSLRTCNITIIPELVKKDRLQRVNTGISFPRPLLQQVDVERGDIPRTRYIQRILERHLLAVQTTELENKGRERRRNDEENVSSSLPSASEVGPHTKRVAAALDSDSLRLGNNTDVVEPQFKEDFLIDAV
jgi:hypothetical protein